MPDSGYNTAKAAQEKPDQGFGPALIRSSEQLRSTNSCLALADSATDGDVVRLPHAVVPSYRRPTMSPRQWLAGGCRAPCQRSNRDRWTRKQWGWTTLSATGLAANGDQRRVVTDAQAPYFGAVIDDQTLAPRRETSPFFATRYSDWIDAKSSRHI